MIEEFIRSTCQADYVYYFSNLEGKRSILILDHCENVDTWNDALTKLNDYGAIFIKNCPRLVMSLIKQNAPVLINSANNLMSVYLPIHQPIDKLSELVEFNPTWIMEHNNKANKMIIAEERFFNHIIYNRFHEESPKFL